MNKYIEQFQKSLKTLPQIISMDVLDSKKEKSQNRKQKSREHLVTSALSIVNTMTLGGEYVTGDISEQEKSDVFEFVEWFLDRYGNDKKVMRAIEENWPWRPRVFRLYEEMKQEETIKYAEESWDDLSIDEQKRVETLVDIIWSHRTSRSLSITFADGQTWDYDLPKTIPHDQLEPTKYFVKLMIGDFFVCGGGMIYRRKSKEKNKDIVCGFWAGDLNGHRRLLPYPVDALKDACETMPDGSRHVWPDDVYDIIEMPEEDWRSRFRIVK